MRNHETGEFELVVGNRQLLSGFFIVVLLFAVAFAMGYVVGQNSPRSTRLSSEAAAATPPSGAEGTRPQPAAPKVENPEPPPPPADPAPAATDTPKEAAPQPTTQPPREAQTAETPALDAPLAPGSYWQAVAVQRHEAEVVAKALKDRGLPALLSQGPNNLVRVLVGPYNDVTAMGKAKTELENAGFHPIRK
jgi:type IV secretory pathway VirB10-like protein